MEIFVCLRLSPWLDFAQLPQSEKGQCCARFLYETLIPHNIDSRRAARAESAARPAMAVCESLEERQLLSASAGTGSTGIIVPVGLTTVGSVTGVTGSPVSISATAGVPILWRCRHAQGNQVRRCFCAQCDGQLGETASTPLSGDFLGGFGRDLSREGRALRIRSRAAYKVRGQRHCRPA